MSEPEKAKKEKANGVNGAGSASALLSPSGLKTITNGRSAGRISSQRATSRNVLQEKEGWSADGKLSILRLIMVAVKGMLLRVYTKITMLMIARA